MRVSFINGTTKRRERGQVVEFVNTFRGVRAVVQCNDRFYLKSLVSLKVLRGRGGRRR